MMTVKELIQELQKFPPDMIVIVADNEYGNFSPEPEKISRSFNQSYDDDEKLPAHQEYIQL